MVDLSFSRFEKSEALTVLPPDLAVMMVSISARQAASPTATAFAQAAGMPFEPSLLAPAHGAFNAAAAVALKGWRKE